MSNDGTTPPLPDALAARVVNHDPLDLGDRRCVWNPRVGWICWEKEKRDER